MLSSVPPSCFWQSLSNSRSWLLCRAYMRDAICLHIPRLLPRACTLSSAARGCVAFVGALMQTRLCGRRALATADWLCRCLKNRGIWASCNGEAIVSSKDFNLHSHLPRSLNVNQIWKAEVRWIQDLLEMKFTKTVCNKFHRKNLFAMKIASYLEWHELKFSTWYWIAPKMYRKS